MQSSRQDPLAIQRYLREMLQCNPLDQSAKIARRRREFIGASMGNAARHPETFDDEVLLQRLRSRANRDLAILRREFYSLEQNRLTSLMKTMSHPKLPEFAAVAKRFQTLKPLRKQVFQAAEQTQDKKFAYSLCRSLIENPTIAAGLEEQYIESMIFDGRVKPALQMVRDFSERYPEIVGLSPAWFKTMLDPGNDRLWRKIPRAKSARQLAFQQDSKTSQGSSPLFLGMLVLIGTVAIVTVVSVLAFLGSRNRHSGATSRSGKKPPMQLVVEKSRGNGELPENRTSPRGDLRFLNVPTAASQNDSSATTLPPRIGPRMIGEFAMRCYQSIESSNQSTRYPSQRVPWTELVDVSRTQP